MNVVDYDGYQRLKGWDEAPFMQPNRGDTVFYDHYLGPALPAGGTVLEIGFGNGNFLGWAERRGAALYGTEVQEAAIAKARLHGVTVLPPALDDSAELLAGVIDVIAAIDVMEHLTLDQNAAMVSAAAAMLKPGGLFIARFPNGQSPLSVLLQNGDHTHVSVMSVPIVRQIVAALPFDVVHAGEPALVVAGGIGIKAVRYAQAALRRAAIGMIRLVFGEIQMHANAVVVLRRR